MGNRTSYTDGTFHWVDLVTTDVGQQKQFYTKLFGWTYEDIPAGENEVYSVAKFNGKKVAAIFEMPDDMRKSGAHPCWLNYIQVADINETSKLFKELGGTVTQPPMDVMTAGKMFSGIDPTGAHISFWQVGDHFGAEHVNDPSTLCWNELNTRDLEKAKDFYHKLLKWDYQTQEGPNPYTTIMNGKGMNGGMINMTGLIPDDVPPHWVPYFNHPNIQEAKATVEAQGGTAATDIMELPVGKFFVAADPSGTTSIIIQLFEVDP